MRRLRPTLRSSEFPLAVAASTHSRIRLRTYTWPASADAQGRRIGGGYWQKVRHR